MLLIKSSKENMEGVRGHSKHASDGLPDASLGDLVLLQTTRTSLEKDRKTVRHVARFVGARIDAASESDAIWGRHWRYIIDLKGIKAIPAFDLKDVQVTNHGYGYIVRHGRLRPDDEQSVLTYLQSIGVALP